MVPLTLPGLLINKVLQLATWIVVVATSCHFIIPTVFFCFWTKWKHCTAQGISTVLPGCSATWPCQARLPSETVRHTAGQGALSWHSSGSPLTVRRLSKSRGANSLFVLFYPLPPAGKEKRKTPRWSAIYLANRPIIPISQLGFCTLEAPIWYFPTDLPHVLKAKNNPWAYIILPKFLYDSHVIPLKKYL